MEEGRKGTSTIAVEEGLQYTKQILCGRRWMRPVVGSFWFWMRHAWTTGSIETMVCTSDGCGVAWTVVQANATSQSNKTRVEAYFLSERNTTFKIR